MPGAMETDSHIELEASALPIDVEEEIEDLYYYVPEVQQHFKILTKIGEGTFSSVFLARLRHHPQVQDLFALKHIIPTSHPYRILGELKCLQVIGGTDNVMGMELCLRNKDHIVIVMKYFPHHRFQDYMLSFKVRDVQDYMRNLLMALRRVHQFDIIHRDIKPSNFLFNINTKQYSLVDFGLAHEAPVKLFQTNIDRPPIVMDLPNKARQSQSEGKGSTCAMAKLKSDSTEKCDQKDGTAEESGLSQIAAAPVPEKFTAKSPEKCTVLSPSKASLISPNKKVRASPRRKPHEEIPFLPPPPPPLIIPLPKQDVEAEVPSAFYKDNVLASVSTKRKVSASSHKLTTSRASTKHGGNSPRHSQLSDYTRRLQEKASQDRKDVKSLENVLPMKLRRHRPGTLASCQCFGRPVICSICLARAHQTAPRAGTPGFRAPEVLMKHPHQTTAVDIWSAGVIFLSLLSGRYPFFRASDDLMCLCQIISLLGTEEVEQAAREFGKVVTCRPVTRAVDVKRLCTHLRNSPETDTESSAIRQPRRWPEIPDAAIDLLKHLLDPNPFTRITAEDALRHSFFSYSFC